MTNLLRLSEVLQPYRGPLVAALSSRRLEHVERVYALALEIAQANAFDDAALEQTALAAWLHDAARDASDAELLRLAPPQNEIEVAHPLALHGRAGRVLVQAWGMRDAVVLEAIEDHTVGPRRRNVVSMAVYVADISEPGRGVNDNIRALAMTDLVAACRLALENKIAYLASKGIAVHPATLLAQRAMQESQP